MKQQDNIQQGLQKIFDALFLSQQQAGSDAIAPASDSSELQDQECDPQTRIEGLYIISVAARLLRMHPQTLRKYERLGLVNPCRTMGMLRLYNERDLVRIRLIHHLQEDLGLNLAGVEVALNLLSHLMSLHRHVGRASDPKKLQALMETEIAALLSSLGFPLEEDSTYNDGR